MMPAEVDDADFAAVRLATGLGIVVVEAAGNGNRNLGAWTGDLGRRLTRDGAEDSGAIVVASCNRQLETDTSTFGSRVDCYAWGDGVAAANGSGGYRDDFNGTSSAAAIIAGVAVVVQGMHRAATGSFLTSTAMRDLLSDPSGTPQVPAAARQTTPIGVMPDLQAIGTNIGAVLRSPG
jgi:Subtilase family